MATLTHRKVPTIHGNYVISGPNDDRNIKAHPHFVKTRNKSDAFCFNSFCYLIICDSDDSRKSVRR